MRKLTDADLANITGSTIQSYHIETARVKSENCSDSDNYGIVLGRNSSGHYVTWQFHLDENDEPTTYWGHYYLEDYAAAISDYNTRDISLKKYNVTITETLQKLVTVEAESREEAEQIVSDRWRNCEYVLGAEDYTGIVEFVAVLAVEQE
jgi:hypothetical protein